MKIEDLNLSALKYFIDAVEAGSISQSALKNSVSRPAVSQAILRLGEWYGKRLLVHEKRSFELTKEGRDFYENAKKSFSALEASLFARLEDSRCLKIGCSQSLVDLVLPEIEFALKEASNPIVHVGRTDLLLRDLEEKKINMAFALDHGKRSSFKKIEIKSGDFICLSKSGKFENRLITTETRPEVESFLRFLFQRKHHLESHLMVESWSVALKLAQFNLGCCLVPDYLSAPQLKRLALPKWNASYRAVLFLRKDAGLSAIEEKIVAKLSL